MKAKVDELQVAIDPDAVLRLRATPPAGLSDVEVVGEPALDGRTLRVSLKGSATNLADGAPCNVRCIAPGRSFSHHAKLKVSGPKTEKTRPFTLDVSLPIIEAGLFGRDTFDLHVVPEFPTATPATVTRIPFDHPIEVVPSKTGALLVGEPIGFTLSVGSVFKDCRVRVAISEFDEGQEGPSADELSVLLEWGAKLDAPREWRVGCDEAGRPDYAEVDEEDDTYEFHHTVQVFLRKDPGTKKEVWVDAFPSSPLCTAKRPRLTSFALVEVDGDPAKVLDRSLQATLRAVARRAKGGPSLGHSRLVARGAIEGLALDWTTEVAVRLWTHRPAPWPGGEGLRVATPTTGAQVTGSVVDGAFELVLRDGAELGEAELAELAGDDVHPFATLKMPVTVKPGLALEDVLTYDPATYCPLGDGDLARPAPGQTDAEVAVCACTPGVVDLSLVLAPVFGPIEARAIGDDLVVRARLLGGEAYWKEAAPRIEYQVAGQSGWTDGRGRLAKDVVEARFPMSGWPGHGKEVTFRASASNPEARFRRAKPNLPVAVVTTLMCTPAVLSITTSRSTQGGAPALAIRAETRYVPTGKTTRSLVVELSPVAGKVVYHLPSGNEGRCEPDDGSLVAWVTDPAALEQVTSVRVFRAKDGGRLFGLQVVDSPAPIS